MSKLNWVEKWDEFHLKAIRGSAVITQVVDAQGGSSYGYEIKTDDEVVIEESRQTYPRFEDAEREVLARLAALDMPPSPETTKPPITKDLRRPDDQAADSAPRQEEYLETLEYCTNLLPENYAPAHRARLQVIREWVVKPAHSMRARHAGPQVDWKGYAFGWKKRGKLSEVDTPYGRLTIKDAGESRFFVTLMDASGVDYENGVYADGYDSFEEAEQAARSILAEVDAAVIDDSSISSLDFTLDICETFLPLGSAVVHRSRLNWLKGELSSYLM